MAKTRHSGQWTIEDRCQSPWQYLPFKVPPGAAALRVELSYDRAEDAVLDLGCFSPAGFRGWSGGARRTFVLAADSATPGYLPGELEPGTWQVALGLYRIPAAGLRYEVSVTVTSSRADSSAGWPEAAPMPPAPDRPPRRDLPADAGLRWLAGDLHTHSVHSDGVMTIPELARFAVEQGLDFLAVTDHNTTSHHAELPAAASAYGIALLPGQEVTTERGHANALGALPWIDFRQPPDDWLAATERGGGLLSVNHPYGGQLSWTAPMIRRPPLLEVWHWSWLDPRWTIPLSWWMAWHPDAIAVGGSDWHQPGAEAPPGTPTTWVATEDTDPVAVLSGLAAGRVAISAGREGPLLLRADGELVAVGADGLVLTGPDGPIRRIRGDLARFPGDPGAHRLTNPLGATLALTN